MPKGLLLGGVLAALGFGAGHYVATRAPAPEAEVEGPAAATPAAATLSEIEIRDRLIEIVSLPEQRQVAAALSDWLPTLGPEAVPGFLRVFRNQSVRPGPLAHTLIVEWWAGHDPRAAAAWSANFAPKGYASTLAALAIEHWAARDPHTALDKLSVGGYAPIDRESQWALTRGWFFSGKQKGLEQWIEGLGMGLVQQRVLDALARAMVERDGPEAAVAWAETQGRRDPSYRRIVFRRVAKEVTRASPETAVAMCEKHCDEEYGEGIPHAIARMWSWTDPVAAMEWVRDNHPRKKIITDTMAIWRTADFEGLRAWIEAMVADGGFEPWFQPGVASWVKGVAAEGNDPVEAVEWASHIEDPKTRHKVLVHVAHLWQYRDAEAVEAWLQQSPLSEEERDRVRAKRPKS